jgi:hypothetical protein
VTPAVAPKLTSLWTLSTMGSMSSFSATFRSVEMELPV